MPTMPACHHCVHSDVFFLLLTSYVYDTDVGKDLPSYKDYKYGVEYLFISLLAKSKFRTKVSPIHT